ncbi:UNVERIFIED_CONTAM: hypothetical protein RMT77_012711 [Armadillidium vulgare]
MLKLIIRVFLIAAIFIGINNADKSTKEEICKKRGGKYCCLSGICYLSLNETVSTYKEASDLCAKKGATIPSFNIADYAKYRYCFGDFPWKYPLTIFFLPLALFDVGSHCVSMHFIKRGEFTQTLRCSYETPVHVLCVIKLL